MKSILMIGMGKFGHHLCKNLCEMGNQVMIVDMDEKKLEDLLPIVTRPRSAIVPMWRYSKVWAWAILTCALSVSAPISRAAWRSPAW